MIKKRQQQTRLTSNREIPPRTHPLRTARRRHVAATSVFLASLLISLGGTALWPALLETTLHVNCGFGEGKGNFVCPGGNSLIVPWLELALVAIPTAALPAVLFFLIKSIKSWRVFALATVLPTATLAMALAQHSDLMPLSAEFKLVIVLEIVAITFTVFGASTNSLTAAQVSLTVACCCYAVAIAVEPNILSAGALSMGAVIAASLRRPEYGLQPGSHAR